MNNTVIGTASTSNVLQALEGIGFTVDTSNGTARWGNDTNNKLYFKVVETGSNTTIALYNSANSMIWGSISLTTASTYRMTYDVIGESVFFGFKNNSYTGNNIQCAIVAPIESEDDWEYCCYQIGTASQATSRFVNGRTELFKVYSTTQMYNGTPLGVQVVKAYDDNRFLGNVYLTSVSPSIAQVNMTSNMDNNFVEATIGTSKYLIINMLNSNTYTKIAIKKVAS